MAPTIYLLSGTDRSVRRCWLPLPWPDRDGNLTAVARASNLVNRAAFWRFELHAPVMTIAKEDADD
jgi:hypothetical protein